MPNTEDELVMAVATVLATESGCTNTVEVCESSYECGCECLRQAKVAVETTIPIIERALLEKMLAWPTRWLDADGKPVQMWAEWLNDFAKENGIDLSGEG